MCHKRVTCTKSIENIPWSCCWWWYCCCSCTTSLLLSNMFDPWFTCQLYKTSLLYGLVMELLDSIKIISAWSHFEVYIFLLFKYLSNNCVFHRYWLKMIQSNIWSWLLQWILYLESQPYLITIIPISHITGGGFTNNLNREL